MRRLRATMRTSGIPNPAIRRLSLYLRQLDLYSQAGQRTVSSRQLGQSLGISDAQVRKDLAYFGQFGHSGIGYRVDELVARLRNILGTDKLWNVVVIGAGNLGRALLQYRGFMSKGFRLVAAFDQDASKVGKSIGGVVVRPMASLANVAEEYDVRLAILAVPAAAAQDVCDDLARIGVMGILNFAPVALSTGTRMVQNTVDLAVQLEQLSFQVKAMLE